MAFFLTCIHCSSTTDILYELQVKAMGGDNLIEYKITKEIGKKNIKVIPDVMISRTNGTDGFICGLSGLKLMDRMDANAKRDVKTKGN